MTQDSQKQPAQQLYQRLKQDIRDNQLPVGEPLKQEMLSQRYQVSRIPVRDVLVRLKNEGWLVAHGKRGSMVAPYSATEAEDLYLMRMYLEPLILSHAIPLISHQNLVEATEILAHIDSRPSMNVVEYGDLNWRFHACLYRAANRPTLFATIASLHQQCGRYIGFHSEKLDYRQHSQGEHHDLLSLVRDQQTVRAKRLLEAHIFNAGDQLVEHLTKNPDF